MKKPSVKGLKLNHLYKCFVSPATCIKPSHSSRKSYIYMTFRNSACYMENFQLYKAKLMTSNK